MSNEQLFVSQLDFGDGQGPRKIRADGSLDSISVNGVAQEISNHAVNLNIADNLITETQWTTIQSILS